MANESGLMDHMIDSIAAFNLCLELSYCPNTKWKRLNMVKM